jgi:hypothetical protein
VFKAPGVEPGAGVAHPDPFTRNRVFASGLMKPKFELLPAILPHLPYNQQAAGKSRVRLFSVLRVRGFEEPSRLP